LGLIIDFEGLNGFFKAGRIGRLQCLQPERVEQQKKDDEGTIIHGGMANVVRDSSHATIATKLET
jgi:hypothetical protein